MTDTVEDYISQYGYFGQLLYEGVQKERQVVITPQIPTQQRPTIQIPQVNMSCTYKICRPSDKSV